MKKPWSISTTVRNPERLRDFLVVLKTLESKKFDDDFVTYGRIYYEKAIIYTA